VLDLTRIPELRGIEFVDGWLDFGAATTFSELRLNEHVVECFPILAEVASTIGGWQIQNRATVGGNIANASPAGDSLPVLLALDAELTLAGVDGQRKVRYSEMHRGYRKTKLRPGELIVRIKLPVPRPHMVQRFRKVGTREAQAISKVVLAFTADIEDGKMFNARLAAGSVAPRPVRLRKAEKACEGLPSNETTADLVAATAAAEVQPIDDVRSTAAYRKHVLERLVRRMILQI
jgi:carbon-monoxide dehydrogenase medium subunit